MSSRSFSSSRPLRRTSLAMGLAMGIGLMSGGVFAQSNITGSIFGQVANAPDSTVVIENVDTGLTRSSAVDASGRYRFTSLPTGTYKVTLQNHGAAVNSRDNVQVKIAGGTEVSFGAAADSAAAQNLEGVSVIASALPAIDVSSVDTRTVLTSEQLAKLPIARSITAAALLAPGVVDGSSYTAPSFGGSAASENSYSINGYDVTNPLTSIGSTTLPFDAIDQEQVLTGGFGAEFGRSTGGVINIVTKRGTNEWKAGAYTIWTPKALKSDPRNSYYPNTGAYGADYPVAAKRTDGTLYQYNNDTKTWQSTVGAYASGPLIKDRLFFYLNAEMTRTEGQSVLSTPQSSSGTAKTGWNDKVYKDPRWTAKIDWNITDNHILELTGVSDKETYDSSRYAFNYTDRTHGDTKNSGVHTKDGGELYIGKYTGYLTDDLTITALVGTQKIDHLQQPFGYRPECPYISSDASVQVPGVTYNKCQFYGSLVRVPGANDKTYGGRLDVEYHLGDHDLRVGYDRKTAQTFDGTDYPGGVNAYYYSFSEDPSEAVDPGHGVIGSPAQAGGYGTQGYYVDVYHSRKAYTVKVEQEAEYIEDRWQVSRNWLLSLGLRNEQFNNYNASGKIYAAQRHQLAPRLGASWDVFGDSTLKVYAHAGRYHLAVPASVATRGGLGGSLASDEYFTYTGVDPVTGAPLGLNRITVDPTNQYVCAGTLATSSNLECGVAGKPSAFVTKNLKSHYQDEYILGMEQQLTPSFNYGAKLTYRSLKNAIDDTCAPVLGGACIIFNPGNGITYDVQQEDGSFKSTTVSKQELGLPDLKRDYYALDMYLEHPFGNNWYGRIDYTFSRSYGNTEGQLASDLDTGAGGQADVSATQDWDLPQLMVGANGPLPNDRTHQIKARGYYQVSSEWRFGATATVASGRPKTCTSFYPTADAGLYNGAYYRWCGLPNTPDYHFAPRGSEGRTPWTYQLNLNAAYTPNWADNKFTFQVDVINVLNSQKAQYYYPNYATNRTTVNARYGQELNYTTPRYFRLSARYDF